MLNQARTSVPSVHYTDAQHRLKKAFQTNDAFVDKGVLCASSGPATPATGKAARHQFELNAYTEKPRVSMLLSGQFSLYQVCEQGAKVQRRFRYRDELFYQLNRVRPDARRLEKLLTLLANEPHELFRSVPPNSLLKLQRRLLDILGSRELSTMATIRGNTLANKLALVQTELALQSASNNQPVPIQGTATPAPSPSPPQMKKSKKAKKAKTSNFPPSTKSLDTLALDKAAKAVAGQLSITELSPAHYLTLRSKNGRPQTDPNEIAAQSAEDEKNWIAISAELSKQGITLDESNRPAALAALRLAQSNLMNKSSPSVRVVEEAFFTWRLQLPGDASQKQGKLEELARHVGQAALLAEQDLAAHPGDGRVKFLHQLAKLEPDFVERMSEAGIQSGRNAQTTAALAALYAVLHYAPAGTLPKKEDAALQHVLSQLWESEPAATIAPIAPRQPAWKQPQGKSAAPINFGKQLQDATLNLKRPDKTKSDKTNTDTDSPTTQEQRELIAQEVGAEIARREPYTNLSLSKLTQELGDYHYARDTSQLLLTAKYVEFSQEAAAHDAFSRISPKLDQIPENLIKPAWAEYLRTRADLLRHHHPDVSVADTFVRETVEELQLTKENQSELRKFVDALDRSVNAARKADEFSLHGILNRLAGEHSINLYVPTAQSDNRTACSAAALSLLMDHARMRLNDGEARNTLSELVSDLQPSVDDAFRSGSKIDDKHDQDSSNIEIARKVGSQLARNTEVPSKAKDAISHLVSMQQMPDNHTIDKLDAEILRQVTQELETKLPGNSEHKLYHAAFESYAEARKASTLAAHPLLSTAWHSTQNWMAPWTSSFRSQSEKVAEAKKYLQALKEVLNGNPTSLTQVFDDLENRGYARTQLPSQLDVRSESAHKLLSYTLRLVTASAGQLLSDQDRRAIFTGGEKSLLDKLTALPRKQESSGKSDLKRSLQRSASLPSMRRPSEENSARNPQLRRTRSVQAQTDRQVQVETARATGKRAAQETKLTPVEAVDLWFTTHYGIDETDDSEGIAQLKTKIEQEFSDGPHQEDLLEAAVSAYWNAANRDYIEKQPQVATAISVAEKFSKEWHGDFDVSQVTFQSNLENALRSGDVNTASALAERVRLGEQLREAMDEFGAPNDQKSFEEAARLTLRLLNNLANRADLSNSFLAPDLEKKFNQLIGLV